MGAGLCDRPRARPPPLPRPREALPRPRRPLPAGRAGPWLPDRQGHGARGGQPVSSVTAHEKTVDDVLADLDRDGYSIVPNVLTRDEAATIREELTAIADAIPHGRNSFEGFQTRRIYALFRKTRLMDAAATHPLVLGVLDQVLRDYQLSAPT